MISVWAAGAGAFKRAIGRGGKRPGRAWQGHWSHAEVCRIVNGWPAAPNWGSRTRRLSSVTRLQAAERLVGAPTAPATILPVYPPFAAPVGQGSRRHGLHRAPLWDGQHAGRPARQVVRPFKPLRCRAAAPDAGVGAAVQCCAGHRYWAGGGAVAAAVAARKPPRRFASSVLSFVSLARCTALHPPKTPARRCT